MLGCQIIYIFKSNLQLQNHRQCCRYVT